MRDDSNGSAARRQALDRVGDVIECFRIECTETFIDEEAVERDRA